MKINENLSPVNYEIQRPREFNPYQTPLLTRDKPLRVSRRHPCKICGKPDYCGVSVDSVIAFCTRVSSGSFKTARNGAFMHRLIEQPASFHAKPNPRPAPTAEDRPRADADHLDRIYSMLLRSHLVLAKQHRAQLQERGLDAAAIAGNGYASAPTATYAKAVTREVSRYDLRGVPGFYREAGEWRMADDYGSGFYIPIRDAHARITALQIRRDVGQPKYLWLSPSSKPGATPSGAPCHYAKSHLLHDAREVTLVEGMLKSDIAAHFLNQPVIGNAPSCFGADFAENLRTNFPKLQTVYVAFDMDFKRNEHVRAAMFRLTTQLERVRFQVRVRTWPPEWKGIDNYLLAIAQQEVAA
jgi:hypothetical protein